MTSLSKLIAAAAGAALAAAAPIQAAPGEPVQATVRYTDLDLGTAEGRDALENRIEAAARAMCGLNEAPTTGTRMPSASSRACYKKATSQIGESIARAVEKREAKS